MFATKVRAKTNVLANLHFRAIGSVFAVLATWMKAPATLRNTDVFNTRPKNVGAHSILAPSNYKFAAKVGERRATACARYIPGRVRYLAK